MAGVETTEGPGGGPQASEILVFEVAGVHYALPVGSVEEILRAVAIVPLPQAPPVIEGLIDVRGSVVPVLDLRSRFRLPPRAVRPSDHLILAHAGPRRVAVRADRAVDLVRLDPARVEEASRVVPAAEFVAGIAKLSDGLVLIHDLGGFLTQAEAERLDRSLRCSSTPPGEA